MLAFLTGAGVLFRLMLDRSLDAALSWLLAALLIPGLALALGTWSGGSKAFEIVYLLWWYAGPLNRVPALDFMGISPGSAHPFMYLSMIAALLGISLMGRSVRPRYA